jgi:SAM-dependent methyltransferase
VNQDLIWEHFQNEGRETFQASLPRQAYLVSLLRAPGKVLNIGVGGGLFEEIASREGFEIHSLDPSERAIEGLRKRLNIGDRARVGYCQTIPFGNDEFDAVVMSEVLEHLDDATLAASLTEIHRVLRPGGVFLGTVPADEVLAEQNVVCPRCNEHFHRWGHMQSFSRETLTHLLAPRFRLREIRTRHFIHWAGLNWAGKAFAVLRTVVQALGKQVSGGSLVFIAERNSPIRPVDGAPASVFSKNPDT